MDGGQIVAAALKAQGVTFLYTLVGGHISPILVAAQQQGIRVVDVRHEATAVFAADATARLTGIPGVAAVTAGPGVTNTLTAVKNAQMAQSPVVLIGGAAPTALKGRGALQDIDQVSLFRTVVKWSAAVRRVRDVGPALNEAFRQAQSGVPGPVFVEFPVDLLYAEPMVRQLYGAQRGGRSLGARAVQAYLRWHVNRLFAGSQRPYEAPPAQSLVLDLPAPAQVAAVAARLAQAQRPVILVGSQALLAPDQAPALAQALTALGAPIYLSGMARGLLGRNHPLHVRHQRRAALKEADLVLLAGVPCDFRLDYGNQISRRARYIAVNRSREDLTKNRRPDIGVQADPGAFLRQLSAQQVDGERWAPWLAQLQARDRERNAEIAVQAQSPSAGINPLHLCREINAALGADSIIVADGGDFVATASYIVQPPGPLTWLDPGPFGTLGVGAGFALAAKLCRPAADVWLLYGDGAAGFSLMEFDTLVRHHVPVLAVVGNDGGWTQIAREQVEMLHSDVATVLAQTDYHRVVEGLGAVGFKLDDPELAAETLAQAAAAAVTRPVLVNAMLGKTDFRKGSISM
jgi:acetolactate synthase-1/2/3 large subunit